MLSCAGRSAASRDCDTNMYGSKSNMCMVNCVSSYDEFIGLIVSVVREVRFFARQSPAIMRLVRKRCARVVRISFEHAAQSLVPLERHKTLALFRIAFSARHKAFDPCAYFISLYFFSVKYSNIK